MEPDTPSRDASWGSASTIGNNETYDKTTDFECHTGPYSTSKKERRRSVVKNGFMSLIERIKNTKPEPNYSETLITPPESPQRQDSNFIEYLVSQKSSAVLKRLNESTDKAASENSHTRSDSLEQSALRCLKTQTYSFGEEEELHIIKEDADSCYSSSSACSRALAIPEILINIFKFVDEDNLVPRELAQKRRKPLSLRHAMLIYGENDAARRAWDHAQNDERRWSQILEKSSGAGLYNCLTVNKTWYSCVTEVLYHKLHFKTQQSWDRFATHSAASDSEQRFNSSCLVLHKMSTARQSQIDQISASVGGSLQWLEFYTCPSIVPTAELLKGNRLTKLVLPGCSRVNNRTIHLIAQNCPALEHLDIRACEQVSDWGLKHLSKSCTQLKLLNVGRTNHGELITTRGVKYIARRTNIDTLGLAGCLIDDRAIWEVARHRGPYIQRLSLNNCRLLTNDSIPKVLGYTKNLSVLELRGCVQITDMRPIVLFKRARERMGRPPLIEGCEVFELRMKESEWMMEIEASRTIVADCLEWIYRADDDIPLESLRVRLE